MEDVPPLERAAAFQTLLDLGHTQQGLAAKLGLSRDAIARTVRLLNLTAEARIALSIDLSESAARETLRLNVFDQVCGDGAANTICHRILWNRTRARRREDVRELCDWWLAGLYAAWLHVEIALGWLDGYVDEMWDRRGDPAFAWRPTHAGAWIARVLKPDFSKLPEADLEVLRDAFGRMGPPEDPEIEDSFVHRCTKPESPIAPRGAKPATY